MSSLEDAINQLEATRLRQKLVVLQDKLKQLEELKPTERDQDADQKKKINIEQGLRSLEFVQIEEAYAQTLELAVQCGNDPLKVSIQDASKRRQDMSMKTMQILSNYLTSLGGM